MNPVSTWPTRMMIGFVKGYRLFFSAWLGSSCRFSPTCSEYSMQALQLHGAASGVYLTLARLARCHPWCQGGIDPVPQPTPLSPRTTLSARPAADGHAAQVTPRKLFP
jgi:uncharacterized protein